MSAEPEVRAGQGLALPAGWVALSDVGPAPATQQDGCDTEGPKPPREHTRTHPAERFKSTDFTVYQLDLNKVDFFFLRLICAFICQYN